MRIDIVTIFPNMVTGPLSESIIGRAVDQGLVDIRVHDLRQYTDDRHRTADDAPYGGGPGMVMKPEPFFRAVDHLRDSAAAAAAADPARVILMAPQGRVFRQETAWELAQDSHLIFLCGRYEGVDDRVRTHLATDEISIGDYVLTGGELPALVVADAVVRLIPGVLGSEESPLQESFHEGLLEGPHFTRPQIYRGLEVPELLRSGNHEAIRQWRRQQALQRTLARRPELLARAALSEQDRAWLKELEG